MPSARRPSCTCSSRASTTRPPASWTPGTPTKKRIRRGRFTIAAKHHITIAEIYEAELVDIEKAIAHYEQAADYYKGEESNSSANKCLLKVAAYAAQLEQYQKAIEIYEQVGTNTMDNPLLKYSAKEYFFKAALCHFIVDELNAKLALEKYEEMFPAFTDSRECKLLKKLLEAHEEQNSEAYTEAVSTRGFPRECCLSLLFFGMPVPCSVFGNLRRGAGGQNCSSEVPASSLSIPGFSWRVHILPGFAVAPSVFDRSLKCSGWVWRGFSLECGPVPFPFSSPIFFPFPCFSPLSACISPRLFSPASFPLVLSLSPLPLFIFFHFFLSSPFPPSFFFPFPLFSSPFPFVFLSPSPPFPLVFFSLFPLLSFFPLPAPFSLLFPSPLFPGGTHSSPVPIPASFPFPPLPDPAFSRCQVKEFDSISRLDQWLTTMLLRIKKTIQGEGDGDLK
uniref:Beta-soluble NSF attachment protein n=1 Tax=Cyanistes caeruleus TaxID=156563 RepID=A0A8C0ZA59_CYACU